MHDDAPDDPRRLPRRTLLRSGAVAAGLLAAGCTPGTDEVAAGGTPPPEAAATQTAATPLPATAGTAVIDPARFDAVPTCAMTPSAPAGPFPNREALDREDITEGRPGLPVRLGFRVVQDACTPVEGAAVAVWHTDHTGDYSSYDDGGSGKDEGEGTTFLRGVQSADANGIVSFRTIFPGWYEGRAIHIHLRVDTPDGRSLTTQVYFDETLTTSVLTNGVYAEFGEADTSVAADFLAGDPAADGTQLHTEPATVDGTDGLVAILNLGLPA